MNVPALLPDVDGVKVKTPPLFERLVEGQGTQTHKTTRDGLDHLGDERERIKKLAGLYDNPHATQDSMGENISQVATAKAEYQRKHDIKPGTQEWFKLWFAQPRLTGENPMPKK